MRAPSNDYPWHWSIYRWIDGENVSINSVDNLSEFAVQLSDFTKSFWISIQLTESIVQKFKRSPTVICRRPLIQ